MKNPKKDTPKVLKNSKKSNPNRSMGPDRMSQVAENYLLSLYNLSEEGYKSTPAHLAEHLRSLPAGEGLGTSLPSVLGMLRRMEKEGLLMIGQDKEVHLTDEGLIAAKGMVRRHRLAERMVVDILGLDLHKAHVEAHRLEHAISPEIESKIDEILGHPTTCPFGGPIPGSNYSYPENERIKLNQVPAGQKCTINRVPEDDQDLLIFLIKQGILPGREVEIIESSMHTGIIIMKTQQGEPPIAHTVANKIWVLH